jgi:copper chaperone CopZ
MTCSYVTRRVILCGMLIGLAALIAGCGSSKPAYCKDRTALQKSVSSLTITGGVSALKSQLQTIEGQVKSLGSSAKSDFPTQTTAVDGALSSLETSVKALPSSPSASQLATVAVAVKNTVTSVSAFVSATKSKCS